MTREEAEANIPKQTAAECLCTFASTATLEHELEDAKNRLRLWTARYDESACITAECKGKLDIITSELAAYRAELQRRKDALDVQNVRCCYRTAADSRPATD